MPKFGFRADRGGYFFGADSLSDSASAYAQFADAIAAFE